METKKTFIIAEVGVNHDGRLDRAIELIALAKQAGADAVKFQTFVAERLVTSTASTANYQANATGDLSQLKMLKRLELTYADFKQLADRCASEGIQFLSTPFDPGSLDFLELEIGLPLHKVGSGDLTNRPLLERIGQTGKPVLLSTGMANLGEIEEALEWIGHRDVTLLHCTTSYPTPPEYANLQAMQTLRSAFGLAVGYSDHTEGITVPLAAVAMGAEVIEKHMTYSRTAEGPDHRASLEPAEFAEMVRQIRLIEASRGDGQVICSEIEAANRSVARKSVVTQQAVQKGQLLTEDRITVKRPANGIEPKYFYELSRYRAKADLPADHVLTWKDVEPVD